MKFMILIWSDEEAWAQAKPEDFANMMERHRNFARRVGELGGTIEAGEALESQQMATSVRDDQVTDGPFVETKESLGGFYVIDAPDRETALVIARECPTNAVIELRPIWDTSNM
jgi:hypothetical protein